MKELVFKKGIGYVDKQTVPLTDNNIIEQVDALPVKHYIYIYIYSYDHGLISCFDSLTGTGKAWHPLY